jgi:hypothetical protein
LERDGKQQQTARGRRDRLTAATTRCATEKGMAYRSGESRLGPQHRNSLLVCICCSYILCLAALMKLLLLAAVAVAQTREMLALRQTCENNAWLGWKPKPNRPDVPAGTLCLIHLHTSVSAPRRRSSLLSERRENSCEELFSSPHRPARQTERERERRGGGEQRTNHSDIKKQ